MPHFEEARQFRLAKPGHASRLAHPKRPPLPRPYRRLGDDAQGHRRIALTLIVGRQPVAPTCVARPKAPRAVEQVPPPALTPTHQREPSTLLRTGGGTLIAREKPNTA